MKRIWKNLGVTLGTVFFTGAIVSACAHNDSSVFIRQVFAPGTISNGLCTYSADITQASLSFGIADVAFPELPDVTEPVLVGNQISSQADPNAEQTETSRVTINGAITRITDLAGDTSLETMFATMCDGGKGDEAACMTGRALVDNSIATPVNPFSTVETTAIEPSTSGTPQYSVLGLTLVDGATIDVMRSYFVNLLTINKAKGISNPAFTTTISLISYTKVEGVTSGGDPVESNEFEFPVNFVYGQLVLNGFYADSASPVGVCLASAKSSPTCVDGQDLPASATEVVGTPDCPAGTDGGTGIPATPTADGGGGG